METEDPNMILCIPGNWESREALTAAIVQANPDLSKPRYMALGHLMMDMIASTHVGLEIYGSNPGLETSFSHAGQGRLSDEVLAEIRDHKCVVYITSDDIGTTAAAALMEAGDHLLRAGGIALLVENAGIAHDKDRLAYHAEEIDELDLIDIFTVAIGADSFFYTCGMHHFDRPDVSVDLSVGAEASVEVLYGFNQWQLLESPLLKAGRYFSLGQGEPIFVMSHQDYGYDPASPLNNPKGRWHLSLSDRDDENRFQVEKDPLVMAVPNSDMDMGQAMQLAKAEIPRLQKSFESSYCYGRFMVKKHIQEGDESGFFWLALLNIQDGVVTGAVFEMPSAFSYRPGEEIHFPVEELSDWCIIRYGTLIGGYTMRVLRANLPKEDLADHDQFTGTISFLPLPLQSP